MYMLYLLFPESMVHIHGIGIFEEFVVCFLYFRSYREMCPSGGGITLVSFVATSIYHIGV